MVRTFSSFCVLGFVSIASAQSNAFTYQGHLVDTHIPANGPHDMRFELFDAATGGNPIGPQLCLDNVNLVDGLFSVELDFGQQFVTTAERHLEISVRSDMGFGCP